jgi:hypothetical protein
MKRTALLCGFIACAVALLLWFSFSRQQRIRHHTSGWNKALHHMAKSKPPLFRRIFHLNESPNNYWHKAVTYHEKALFDLGYLTNCEFRLTNQIVTRGFYSNFYWLIRQRLGTNTDQVWSSSYLTNQEGIRSTLPVKDVVVWEKTFRECAGLYASNLPMVTTPNAQSE